jgi:hypothetical protein
MVALKENNCQFCFKNFDPHIDKVCFGSWQEEFNKNAGTSTSDSMEGLDGKEQSGRSQAAMMKQCSKS